VFYVLIEFFSKWTETGRFPREELRISRELAIAFGAVLLILAAALLARAF
jgi:hypothetical protein